MKKMRTVAPVVPSHLAQVVAGDDPAAAAPDATDTTASTVSNVLKTRHDTVKNTISNVR